MLRYLQVGTAAGGGELYRRGPRGHESAGNGDGAAE